VSNQISIALDCWSRRVTPTHVAGFRAFLDLNRCVRKGEKAIRILAPVTVKQRDINGEETGEKKVFFRTVPVYDVSMTDALPGKELAPPSQPITGDSHHHLIAPLVAHAGDLLYTVEFRQLPGDGPAGWCDAKRQQIVVATGPANRQVRTLTHEIAHGHGLGYAELGRERCEVLVDCVTYCACWAPSVSTAAASRSHTSPAGARTAPSTRSASTRRRSTPSRAASKTRST
jgi:hypothetical protein